MGRHHPDARGGPWFLKDPRAALGFFRFRAAAANLWRLAGSARP